MREVTKRYNNSSKFRTEVNNFSDTEFYECAHIGYNKAKLENPNKDLSIDSSLNYFSSINDIMNSELILSFLNEYNNDTDMKQ